MERYEKYKDSGIAWIGEIPEHWKVIKLKYIGESIIGVIYSPEEIVKDKEKGILVLRSSNIQRGELDLDDCVFIDKEISDKLRVRKGDILICSRNGSRALIGKNITIDERTEGQTFGAFMTIFRTELSNFVSSYFNSQVFNGQSGLFLTSTINQLTINTINNFFIALPPLEEQNRIASFLDHKTAEIDRLISQKEKLIALYEEEKTAIINQAVTQGIDRTVKLKPSGIDWLGDIPEHWHISRAKFVSNIFVPQRNKPELNSDEGIAWLTMEDMISERINTTSLKVTIDAITNAGSKILPKGSIIASCVGNFGVCAINEIDAIINQQLQAFIPNSEKVNIDYFSKLVTISKVYFEIVATAATIVYVNQAGFASMPVVLPPLEEQKAIVAYIGKESDRINAKIAKTKRIIELQKEYRTALISEAVTGKIKVFQND